MTFIRLSLVFLFIANSLAFPFLSNSNSSLVSQLMPSSHISLNMQEMADLAMNPTLNNQSVVELYQESADIINGTDADSVLFELDPANNQSNAKPVLVMAVYNPNGPSHQDLLDRFRLYFVNLTDSLPNSEQVTSAINQLVSNTKHNMWTVFRNFLKNQANAIIGAFWLPFNVGSKAMQQTSSEHAQYVQAGATFGSAISELIIMRAIDLPNNIAQRVVNITNGKVNAVKFAEQQSKQASVQALDAIANGMQASSELAVQYLARPIGAFVGFNLNHSGNVFAGLGQLVNNTGIQLTLLGQRLELGAQDAVTHGASAIVWGLDNKVVLPGEQHNQAATTASTTL